MSAEIDCGLFPDAAECADKVDDTTPMEDKEDWDWDDDDKDGKGGRRGEREGQEMNA